MAYASDSQRRRAAWAVLTPVLDENDCIAALWTLHRGLHSDSVADIIAYIDQVAQRHSLDAATRKRLYAAFFAALRQPPDSLPLDPWPLMQAAQPAAPAPAPGPAPVPVPTAVAHTPVAARLAPVAAAVAAAATRLPTPAPAAPVPSAAASALPAHQVVFATLIRAILTGAQQFHPGAAQDVREAIQDRTRGAKVDAAVRQRFSGVLAASAGEGAELWWLEASAEALATLVHETYVALCEALGPVEADQLLMQSVRQTEQVPQAREFPPNRFL